RGPDLVFRAVHRRGRPKHVPGSASGCRHGIIGEMVRTCLPQRRIAPHCAPPGQPRARVGASMRRGFPVLLGVIAGAVVGTTAVEGLARSGGMQNGGCAGCHADGNAVITLTPSPQSISPGTQVTLTTAVTSEHGSTVGLFVS